MTKAGTSKSASGQRKRLFIEAYLSNGKNATQAAIAAGYSEKSAHAQGCRLLKDVKIQAEIAERTQVVLAKAEIATELTLENILRELGRIALFDPRRILKGDGTMLDPGDWPDDVAAAVGGLEIMEEFEGRGADRERVGFVKKLKFWDKNSAIEKAMKHFGAFEKDNAQQRDNLAIQVVMVAAPGVPR